MIYIRNLFTQDLRDGKQIAFPTEPSNIFFKFSFSKPDSDRDISFRFKEKDNKSSFFKFNGKVIHTRLYAAGSESRIDGQLKQFLRDDLGSDVDDIIVFRVINEKEYEFEFVPKGGILYTHFKVILNNKNHEVVCEDDKEENKNTTSEVKLQFNSAILEYKRFIDDSKKANYIIDPSTGLRFVSSLLTKPFVILTGLAGSGKTKLAQAFAQWICENDTQYAIVPVGADWTNREPLLGFPNALESEKYIKPENRALQLIIEAANNPSKPYFLILDEMNLSHVERYFADFLSAMESKDKIALHSGDEDWGDVPSSISLPKNLFVIGTVNIDETTYMFSPKVLDRASVIEFRVTRKEMQQYLESNRPLNLDNLKGKGAGMAENFVALAKGEHKYSKTDNILQNELVLFFDSLKKVGAEFGYRSASEILRFAAVVNEIETEWGVKEILDAAIMQKLLPKVHGSRRKLESVLVALLTLCLIEGETTTDYLKEKKQFEEFDEKKFKYPLSAEKIIRMYQNLISNGFTSYAEA